MNRHSLVQDATKLTFYSETKKGIGKKIRNDESFILV